MRFPLRLTADLGLKLAGGSLLRSQGRSPITRLDSAELAQPSALLKSLLAPSAASVVWIGGRDPLLHSEIAGVARDLIASGRFVFLETQGVHLARRIHEFQPISRLFWVVPFNASDNSTASEAVRRARLSGFLTCAHTELCDEDKFAEIKQLREQLRALGVDGWVMSTSHEGCVSTGQHARLQQKLHEARLLIPSWGWRLFSTLLEASSRQARSLSQQTKDRQLQPLAESDAGTFQESAGAP